MRADIAPRYEYAGGHLAAGWTHPTIVVEYSADPTGKGRTLDTVEKLGKGCPWCRHMGTDFRLEHLHKDR